LKILPTKKLFFKKYPYRIACKIAGGSDIIRRGVDWTLEYARTSGKSDSRMKKINDWRYRYTTPDYEDLEKFTLTVSPFLSNENLKFRVEGSHFNIYCIDKGIYNDIQKSLYPWIQEQHEPISDKDLEFLLSNRTKILVTALPHELYKFKVILKSTGLNYEKKLKFLNWVTKYTQDKRIRLSSSTIGWLSDRVRYCQSPFMYVKDESTLTLVELYLSNSISNIEEFVLRSSVDLA